MPPQTLLPPRLDRELERHTTAALTANLTAARARSTRRAYQQAWQAFQAFAAAHDAPALPAAPLLVGRYLSTLGEACRPPTVQLHAASITAYHRDAGQASPCAHPGVRKVIAGHARRQGVAPRQAQPIDRTAAQAIAATAARPRAGRGGTETRPQAARRAALDVALVYVMRDGLLRRSEAAALRWADIETAEDGTGRMVIRRSKTDPAGHGAIGYLSHATMRALDRLDGAWGPPQARVFALSAAQISRRIAAAARAAGLGEGYSGHSPRIGMALDLTRAGTELPALMTAGRWASPRMPARYTRNEAAGRNAVACYYRSLASQSHASFSAGHDI